MNRDRAHESIATCSTCCPTPCTVTRHAEPELPHRRAVRDAGVYLAHVQIDGEFLSATSRICWPQKEGRR